MRHLATVIENFKAHLLEPLSIYQPLCEDLNLPEHLKPYEPAIRVWLHYIYRSTMHGVTRRGYVLLMTKLLRLLFPVRTGTFTSIKYAVLNLGLLEHDKHYSIGQRSQGYKLSKRLKEATWHKLPFHDQRLIRLLSNHKAEQEAALLPVHQWLKSKLAEIDLDWRAFQKAKGHKAMMLDEIRQHDLWFGVDEFGYRVHTNITSLPRRKRRYLRHNGKSLREIDIKCSQPLFLALLIKENNNNTRTSPPLYTIYDVPEHIKSDTRLYNDAEMFIQLCEEGTLYDWLLERWEKQISRKQFKRRFFSMLFHWQENETFKAFARLFPSVANFIRHAKAKNYKDLPQLLQRRESEFIIGTVCRRIRQERPETFLLTIHDSILTEYDTTDYVAMIIRDEFDKLGLRPSLSVVPY